MAFKIILVLTVLVNLSLERPVTDSRLALANNYLNLELLNQLSDDKNNVFISPFSISTALAMLYSGAKTSTAQEMRQVLGYDSAKLSDQQIKEQFQMYAKQIKELDSSKYELNVANKMVVQKDFKILDSFKTDLVKYYLSSIESVDFANNGQKAADDINQWVSRETHNKIEKLFDGPLDPSTELVLLNAIYFNGKFQREFAKNETKEHLFYTADDNAITADMMHSKGKFNFTQINELDSKLLEISYSGQDISLYVLLPNQRQGLKKLRSDVKDFSIVEKSIAKLREEKELEVFLPKFKIETKYSLAKELSRLGMKSAFSGSADLSGIDGQKDLEVSDVIHKAYIEVSEEGTEAAAATGVVIIKNALPPQFRADHPFMFFIRNNINGMVLFSGHVNQISN